MSHDHHVKLPDRRGVACVSPRIALSAALLTFFTPQWALAQGVRSSPPTSPAAGSAERPRQAADGLASRVASRAAQAAYRTHCLICHGSDGRAEAARDLMRKIPDFTSDTWQASRTDAQIGEVIRAGKGKSMPAMEGKVSREDRERLVALIRGFRGGKQSIAEDEEESEAGAAAVAVGAGGAEANPSLAPSSAPRLRTIVTYQKSCLVCHGPDGKGTPAAAGLHGLPDFRNKAWHAQRTPTQLAVSILEGKGKRMPAFRGKLTEPDARELALYVRTLGGASTASPNRTDPGEFEKQLDTLLREFDRLRRESRQLSQDSRRSMDAPTASNERE